MNPSLCNSHRLMQSAIAQLLTTSMLFIWDRKKMEDLENLLKVIEKENTQLKEKVKKLEEKQIGNHRPSTPSRRSERNRISSTDTDLRE